MYAVVINRGSIMVYCTKCGNQNPENAEFCGKCGANLRMPMMGQQKECDKNCDDQCAGGRRGASLFWGVLVIVIGVAVAIWALSEGGVRLPAWITTNSVGMLIGIIIAIALVVTGISIIVRRARH